MGARWRFPIPPCMVWYPMFPVPTQYGTVCCPLSQSPPPPPIWYGLRFLGSNRAWPQILSISKDFLSEIHYFWTLAGSGWLRGYRNQDPGPQAHNSFAGGSRGAPGAQAHRATHSSTRRGEGGTDHGGEGVQTSVPPSMALLLP